MTDNPTHNMPTSPPIAQRTITRDQHDLSRKQMSPNALRVLYRLRESGFGAYLVGGAVRDLLVGRAPKDYDVATDATPEQVKALFRNCRLIGRRFRLAHVVYGREIIEVATFRAGGGDDIEGDRKVHADGRVLRDNIYGSIEEDAIRRDFTANALYYAIEDFSVRDYTGGYADVQAKLLRLIGDPEARYREDPVRMLRAARLAAKLGFTIEASTAEPIPRLAPLLAESAPARLFEETLKMFLSGHAVASFELLEANGLLPALLPETAQALASNKSGALRRMLIDGLGNTDRRVAEDEPVSPAFLYAVLLWPAYCRALALLQAQGIHAVEAQRRAADRVTMHQVSRTALPRRFSLPMQEIWLLQPRFALRQRKRVFRLLAHPRFRAAFDFLELRLSASNTHADDVAFWREAQLDPAATLAAAGHDAGPGDDADAGLADADLVDAQGEASEEPAPRKRHRRRRPQTGAV